SPFEKRGRNTERGSGIRARGRRRSLSRGDGTGGKLPPVNDDRAGKQDEGDRLKTEIAEPNTGALRRLSMSNGRFVDRRHVGSRSSEADRDQNQQSAAEHKDRHIG